MRELNQNNLPHKKSGILILHLLLCIPLISISCSLHLIYPYCNLGKMGDVLVLEFIKESRIGPKKFTAIHLELFLFLPIQIRGNAKRKIMIKTFVPAKI